MVNYAKSADAKTAWLTCSVIQKELKMKNLRVLFVCTHNGARSKIAEAFAKLAPNSHIEAHSASFESERIGSIPISVMTEIGIAFQSTPPKSVFERMKDHESYDYVIALCDPDSLEQVPVFLSVVDKLYHKTSKRLNWSIPNFRSLSGSDEDKLNRARQIRDLIKAKVLDFLSQLGIDSDFS
jgi:arsenate reductase (thioredoxin)